MSLELVCPKSALPVSCVSVCSSMLCWMPSPSMRRAPEAITFVLSRFFGSYAEAKSRFTMVKPMSPVAGAGRRRISLLDNWICVGGQMYFFLARFPIPQSVSVNFLSWSSNKSIKVFVLRSPFIVSLPKKRPYRLVLMFLTDWKMC